MKEMATTLAICDLVIKVNNRSLAEVSKTIRAVNFAMISRLLIDISRNFFESMCSRCYCPMVYRPLTAGTESAVEAVLSTDGRRDPIDTG